MPTPLFATSIAFIWWVAVEWGGWSCRAGRGGRVALGFQA